MPTKIELLPCPFCGGKAEIENRGWYDERYVDVMCEDCRAMTACYANDEAAVKAWNTRTPGWIPCNKRMPKSIGNRCIVFCQSNTVSDFVGYGHYEGSDGWFNLETGKPFEDWELIVTHWMPLPQNPKGE